ncbi:MAG: ABC transporter substrate-binding protein [Terricaulis sp.]
MDFSGVGFGPHIDRRRLMAGALGAAVTLPTLGCSSAEAKPLTVGGLAVTCNLTLPVACAASEAANGASPLGFEYSKFTGWPELKESLMSGGIQAAYMLAPLVMDLADKNVPVKIVSIGHRSGAVIMVRTDSSYRRFRDLAGKRIAIPSRFAVDFLFLRKMLSNENMTPDDVEIVEMAPADMPAALYVNGVDAYCTGEPFGAAAQSAGLCKAVAHDARRVAPLYVLRADRARRADRVEPAAGSEFGQSRAGRWRLARPAAGESRDCDSNRRKPEIFQPRPQHSPLRHD